MYHPQSREVGTVGKAVLKLVIKGLLGGYERRDMAVDRQRSGFCVHGNEHQVLMKRSVFIDEFRNDQLLRKDSSASSYRK